MMNQNTILIRNNQIIARQIDGEFVVLDINVGKLYNLNPTAKIIWKFLAKPRTVDEIVEKIINEFDVPEKIARKDVNSFVNENLGTLIIEQ